MNWHGFLTEVALVNNLTVWQNFKVKLEEVINYSIPLM